MFKFDLIPVKIKQMLAELEKISIGEDGGFRAAYLNDSGGFWHFHPEFELILNTKSYGTRIIGDNAELFDHYDMTLVAGNIPHCWNHYKVDGKVPQNHGISVHFSLASFGENFLRQHEMRCVKDLFSEAERGIAFSVEEARNAEKHMEKMVNLNGIDKLIELFTIFKILCSTEKRRPLCSENYKIAFDERGNKKMTEVFTFIRENFYRPITLEEISKITNMSPFSFSRYFKRNSGAGFVEYVNQVRTNKACYLLRETDNQVNEIAINCGFASISNFNKQFRKLVGISPSDYRTQYKS
jgi:AraC-like DNA-binding protein